MSKTITIRVSDKEYAQIAALAKAERRPISNLIMHGFFNAVANMFTVNEKEMKEILDDKELAKSMKAGLQQIKEGKYKIVA